MGAEELWVVIMDRSMAVIIGTVVIIIIITRDAQIELVIGTYLGQR